MIVHDTWHTAVPVADNAPEWDAGCTCGWYDPHHGSEGRAAAAADQHMREAE